MSKDIDLVSQVASKFLNDRRPRVVPVERRGHVNKVFRVETSDTKLLIRVRNESIAFDEYRKEAWCIDKAASLNVPVATVLEVGVFDDHPYMIQPFIPGDEGRDSSFPRNDIWKQLGKYARLIHSVQVAGFGLTYSNLTQGNAQASWLEYLPYNIESLNEDDELLRRNVLTQPQSKIIGHIFEELEGQSFTFGLNHGDLSVKNVIVDESGKVTLLDWGSAEASMVPHHDLIQLLKMNMLENDPDDGEIHSFLEGYGLSRTEFALMLPTLETLLLLRAFDKLRWAIDCGIEGLESYIIHARRAVVRKLSNP